MAIATDKPFGRLLEPGLRKIFFETYKEKAAQYTDFMNILTSKKAIETDGRLGGFSMWGEKGYLDSTEYEDLTNMDTVMYKHTTFSKGFQIEKERVDDEQYNIINKAPKALARAARATIETKAAIPLNVAYTATAGLGIPGEALIGTHKLLGGGTTTNDIGKLTLNEPNLEIAYKLAAEQVDERGLKIQMMPDVLIVPRALQFVAEKIVKTSSLPSVNNTSATFAENDINPMKGKMKVVVLDYLTNPKMWFLVDSTMNPLNFFWRERLNFKSTNDFDTDVAKYKGRMRFSYGWTDYRGILASKPD